MTHAGGRPTEYDPKFDYASEVDAYLKECGRSQTTLPKISEFARRLGVNRDTIYEWQRVHPEFSDTIKRIKEAQEEQLMDDGLYGGKEVNSTMAIFLLKVNHGMVETERHIWEDAPEIDTEDDGDKVRKSSQLSGK